MLSNYIDKIYGKLPITDYIIYGDANEDGNVNVNDSNYILKFLDEQVTLSSQSKKNSDVNMDGLINTIDAQLILEYSQGQIISIPATNYTIYGDVNEDGK